MKRTFSVNPKTKVTASYKGYSPSLLQQLVEEYGDRTDHFDPYVEYLTPDEMWDEIVDRYGDEDLANDVLDALGL